MTGMVERQIVQCKIVGCDGYTVLPPHSSPDTEIGRIYSATASQPLNVLCMTCHKVSSYEAKEIVPALRLPYPGEPRETPFYMVLIRCDAENCGTLTRIYWRDSVPLTRIVAVGSVLEVLGRRCAKNHPLKSDSADFYRIVESLEVG